jgi:hypothetical protein
MYTRASLLISRPRVFANPYTPEILWLSGDLEAKDSSKSSSFARVVQTILGVLDRLG